MNILILGGTSDARKVVAGLEQHGIVHAQSSCRVIYSVAGLVRIPKLPCEVISGGFTQYGGLAAYLQQEKIKLVVDITHPFAAKMSTTAVDVCRQLKLPCWRFHREAWQAQSGDQWHLFKDMAALVSAAKDYRSVLLTAGQLSQSVVDQFAQYTHLYGQQQVLRTAAPAQAKLPSGMTWLKAIGPFNHQDEYEVLKAHHIDLLVSKNSGGSATEAKLSAARELGIPVFMLERPSLPNADKTYRSIESCVSAIAAFVSARQSTHNDQSK
ncbi:MAG: precorrin-6A/cobalt-precorrin-6A reductase [Pontibacterium sp.]